MKFDAGNYDIAVIGAGHAGIEAGLACARLGPVSYTHLVWIASMRKGVLPCLVGSTAQLCRRASPDLFRQFRSEEPV